jgi:uncharacterized membrane protein YgcG
VFLPLLLIVKLAIAGAIFYLSWRVRGIPATYNESRSQSTILYNMLIVCSSTFDLFPSVGVLVCLFWFELAVQSLLVVGVLFAIFGSSVYRQTNGRSSLVIVVATSYVVVVTTFLSLGVKIITVIRGNARDKRSGSRGRSGTSKRKNESELDVCHCDQCSSIWLNHVH